MCFVCYRSEASRSDDPNLDPGGAAAAVAGSRAITTLRWHTLLYRFSLCTISRYSSNWRVREENSMNSRC